MDTSDLDVVYLVKRGYRNEELRYSLRTLDKNFPHRSVWFYGGCPSGIKPDHYVHMTQNGPTKWANTGSMLRAVAENDELSDKFVLFNDDFFVMKPIREFPYYCWGTLPEQIHRIEEANRSGSAYTMRLKNTLVELLKEGNGIVNYELHVPFIFDRKKLAEMFNSCPRGLASRTLYGNRYKVGGEELADPKLHGPAHKRIPEDPTFLSTDDRAFAFGQVGREIRKTFQKPSRFE